MSNRWCFPTIAITVALAACNSSDTGGLIRIASAGTTGHATAGSSATGAAGSGTTDTSIPGLGGAIGIGAGAGAGASVATSAGIGGSSGSGAGAAGVGGSAAAADGGAAGAAAVDRPPFKPTGDPITATDNQWTWVPFPDSKCRDGSMAGISVNLNSASNKLMIYLEGGGACFDLNTCALNPASVLAPTPPAAGILDRTQVANPVRDWNWVYVPYCTGDVHLGDIENVMVPGVNATQQFVGRRNLEAFLNRLVPTFASADQILLTGISAGGFAASSNAEFVQWAFGSVPISMIDDSGPVMSNQYLPSCLSSLERKLWGLDNTIIKLCGADCPDGGDFAIDYAKHIAKVSHGAIAGLIESNQDQVNRWSFGVGTDNGKNDCMGGLLTTPMDATLFEQGLLDYRMLMAQIDPSFSSYLPASAQHTWLAGASLYTQTTDNVKLIDWVTSIVSGTSPGNVGR